MTTLKPWLRWLGAALLLAALVVCIPAVLVRLAGWPLPHEVPDWQRTRTAIQQGDVPARAVIDVLAVIVWITWIQMVWAFAWELAVNVPRAQHGGAALEAPLVPRTVGRGVGRLVAVVLSIGITATATRAVALATPTTAPLLLRAPAAPQLVVGSSRSTTTEPTAPRWRVVDGDNLWDIAEHTLGDGARSQEILDLNPTIRSAVDVRPGQLLKLPSDASVPDERRPAPSVSLQRATASAAYLDETAVTVQRGNNLWRLSEHRLEQLDGTPVDDHSTLAYVHEVIDANHETIRNPNLIYPGQVIVLPPIGDPPPDTEAASAPPEVSTPAPIPTTSPAPATTASPDVTVPTATTATPVAPPFATVEVLPSVQTHAPAPIASAAARSTSNDVNWEPFLAGATVLATGVVLTHRRRRQRRAVRGAAHLRPGTPGSAALPSAVITACDVPLIRWANEELAALAARLDPRQIVATPVVVEISERHGIELLWDRPQPGAPSPWEADAGGWSWRALYEPDLPLASEPTPAVLPALVTVGERDGNLVLVNLEALGSLAITGEPSAADDVVRSLRAELATGEDLSNAYLHLVGIGAGELPSLDRLRECSQDDACLLLRSTAGDHAQLLKAGRLSSTFQLRLGRDGAIGREAGVVVIEAGALADQHEMVELSPPNRGVALITVGGSDDHAATLDIDADGSAVLRPLGLTFQARRVSTSQAEAIRQSLADIDEPACEADNEAPAVPSADTAAASTRSAAERTEPVAEQLDLDDEPLTERDTPSVVVRVLGVPRIDEAPKLGRRELNLVAFLACSGGSATESQVIDAVWGGRAIERTTLWNRISRARSVFRDALPPREQGSTTVRLTPDVVTDMQLLHDALDDSTRLSSHPATERLRQALTLIGGVPFDAPGYDWAYERQHYAVACELVERCTLRLVDLALDDDDLTTAREAVSAGLRALRINEPLYRARMRIEAQGGNVAGVRQVYDELVNLLAELDDGDGAYLPAPATETLRDELVGPRLKSA